MLQVEVASAQLAFPLRLGKEALVSSSGFESGLCCWTLTQSRSRLGREFQGSFQPSTA